MYINGIILVVAGLMLGGQLSAKINQSQSGETGSETVFSVGGFAELDVVL